MKVDLDRSNDEDEVVNLIRIVFTNLLQAEFNIEGKVSIVGEKG